MLQFFVSGYPMPKGSMVAYARPRGDGKWRGVLTHSTRSKSWEVTIREQLPMVATPLDGPLGVQLAFYLPRPKTVAREYPSVVPDIDKLARAVLDGLKGVIVDDSRVVDLTCNKRYADAEDVGVWVSIHQLG